MPDAPPPALIRLERYQGFSDQESWGRWSLGTRSSVVVQVKAATTVRVEYAGYLAQFGQRLTVALDGQDIARYVYPNRGGDAVFGQTLRTALPGGIHTLTFTVNRSSRSGSDVVFAPADSRDLGVALRRLSITPVSEPASPWTQSTGVLEDGQNDLAGTLLTGNPLVYRAVDPRGLTVPFRADGRWQLSYSVVPAREGQQFEVTLDGRRLALLTPRPGQRVLRGSLVLPALTSASAHTLGLRASQGEGPGAVDYLVEESAVPPSAVSFYTDDLTLSPGPGRPTFLLPALAVAASALGALWRLLYQRRR